MIAQIIPCRSCTQNAALLVAFLTTATAKPRYQVEPLYAGSPWRHQTGRLDRWRAALMSVDGVSRTWPTSGSSSPSALTHWQGMPAPHWHPRSSLHTRSGWFHIPSPIQSRRLVMPLSNFGRRPLPYWLTGVCVFRRVGSWPQRCRRDVLRLHLDFPSSPVAS